MTDTLPKKCDVRGCPGKPLEGVAGTRAWLYCPPHMAALQGSPAWKDWKAAGPTATHGARQEAALSAWAATQKPIAVPPVALYAAGATEPSAWVCGVCRNPTHSTMWDGSPPPPDEQREWAVMCCASGTCDGCGLALTEKRGRWCPPCWEAQRAKQTAADMARVQRIPEADNPGPVGWEDKTWPTVAALRAEYAAAGKALPAEVWAAKPMEFADAVAREACESLNDYFWQGYVGGEAREELHALVAGWAEKQGGVRVVKDESRVVVLEKAVAP